VTPSSSIDSSSPTPTVAPDSPSADSSSNDFYSASSGPSASPSDGGYRKRQDVAGSVIKLGQNLGYKQTPIRESSQAYGTVGDEQGNIRIASQQVSEQVPWNTWGDSAVTDSLDRFLHYFPDTMYVLFPLRLQAEKS